jgi:flagellar basal-body rod protein FlgG
MREGGSRLKIRCQMPRNGSMDLGLNIAASGMLAEQIREDQLSSDLANASTPGYKPDTAVQSDFGTLLLSNTMTGQTVGTIDTNVEVTKQATNMTQGLIQPTGQPLDFAISGTGFFAVKTANGTEYTRNGQFSPNAQGQLVDQFGDEVLSPTGGSITVSAKGTVPAGALGVFNVPSVTKLGNNNFSGTTTGKATGLVESGQLEESGVDPIQTMTDMTASLQAYQAGQQAIQTISQTLQESASTVGLVTGE